MATQKISVIQETSGFMQRKGSFDTIVKKLSKVSNAAIDMLETTMETTQDEKLKLACATKLLEFYVSVLDKQNTDNITRLIAEYKYKGSPAESLSVVNSRPILDFANIQEVD